jgi:hypothetical protein
MKFGIDLEDTLQSQIDWAVSSKKDVPDEIVAMVDSIRKASKIDARKVQPKAEVTKPVREIVDKDGLNLTPLSSDIPVGYQIRARDNSYIVGTIGLSSNMEHKEITIDEFELDTNFDTTDNRLLVLNQMIDSIKKMDYPYGKIYIAKGSEAFGEGEEWIKVFGFDDEQKDLSTKDYFGTGEFWVYDLK